MSRRSPFMSMVHYVQRCDELIHVTNMVGGYTGQHHVHDAEGFRVWSQGIDPPLINTQALKGCRPCDCGLPAGGVKCHHWQS